MLRDIKYLFLRLLLDDICKKSKCEKCFLNNYIEVADLKVHACYQDDVRRQARRAWGLMHPWEKEIYGTDDE